MRVVEAIERYVAAEGPPRDRRCKACTISDDLPYADDVRRRIVGMYLQGHGKTAIIRAIVPLMREWPAGPDGPRLSRSGIERHMRHMDQTLIDVRAALDTQAKLDGIDLEVFAGRYVSGRAVSKKALVLGDDLLSTGAMRMGMSELTRLALIDRELEQEDQAAEEVASIRAQFAMILGLFRREAGDEVMDRVMAQAEQMRRQYAAPVQGGELSEGSEYSAPDEPPGQAYGRKPRERDEMDLDGEE